MSKNNGELMPITKEQKLAIERKDKDKSLIKTKTIENLRCQVVNGLRRGFEVRMIFETEYRARGVAKTDIGLIVFETNKYGANGFDVLEIVPFEKINVIDETNAAIKSLEGK